MKQPDAFTPPPSKKPVPPAKEDIDAALDEALMESFPASDPIAVSGDDHPPKKRRDQAPAK